MKIGVPKEIKTNENRIALVPAGAEAFVGAGHTVFVEEGAGNGSGFSDAAYKAAGASILPTADDVWQQAEMVMKVKEPIEVEWPRMRRGRGPHFRGDRLGGHRGRLRDGADRKRRAAVADPDVRGGGEDGGAGRRQVPGEGLRGQRYPARWGSRCGAG